MCIDLLTPDLDKARRGPSRAKSDLAGGPAASRKTSVGIPRHLIDTHIYTTQSTIPNRPPPKPHLSRVHTPRWKAGTGPRAGTVEVLHTFRSINPHCLSCIRPRCVDRVRQNAVSFTCPLPRHSLHLLSRKLTFQIGNIDNRTRNSIWTMPVVICH
jgi:hypothetical protein